jgi:hypothetical protein
MNGCNDQEVAQDSPWQKTHFANLIRYKPSQVYFARFRVKGKLIRRSLYQFQFEAALFPTTNAAVIDGWNNSRLARSVAGCRYSAIAN